MSLPHPDPMSRPQQNQVRNVLDTSGLWQFQIDPDEKGEAQGWFNALLTPRPIAVPCSWNDLFDDARNYLGLAWYLNAVWIPSGWREQRVFLRVGSANYAAKVWVNGTVVAEHLGGHLPFVADVSSQLAWDRPNVIAIAVENRQLPERVPPGPASGGGGVAGVVGGFPATTYDFFPYAGWHRPVVLYSVPAEQHRDPVQGLGCEAPLPAAVRAVHIGAWVEDPTLGRYHRFVGTLQRCMTRARAKPLEAHMGRATSRRVESIRTAGADGAWPALPLAAWRDTYDTLHRWAQLVGKTRLALAPRENHWWHTPLYVTARGLTTSPIPYGDRTFEVDFDFVDHNLVIRTGDGATRALALVPRSVADFYREYTRILDSLGLRVRLWPVPVEVEHVIPLDEDHVHASYDAESAHRFWLALAQAARVLRAFRGRFLGKSSPVHFFWGSFDLACTRFSGRRAPEHPGGVPNLADWVTREAYSHECISAGWWPGGGPVQEPAFYAYAYPGPQGLADAPVRPAAASYYPGMREFVLPYDAVRTADQPEEMLLDFLQSTYDAAADLAGWDRAALEWAGARE